jgi:hypothetical protein
MKKKNKPAKFVQITTNYDTHLCKESVFALDADGHVWWHDFEDNKWTPLEHDRATYSDEILHHKG